MDNPLSTYYNQQAQGLGVILPGIAETGLGAALRARKQDELLNQQKTAKQTKDTQDFFDEKKKQLDFTSIDRRLDDERKKQFDQLSKELIELEQQALKNGGVRDADKLREWDQKFGDWKYQSDQQKLSLAEYQTQQAGADKLGFIDKELLAEKQTEYLKRGASPEEVQRMFEDNPDLIQSDKLGKSISDNFAEQVREVITQEGATITETTYKNKLPVYYDKTPDGQFEPRMDDDGNYVLNVNHPVLVAAFKQSKIADAKAKQVRAELQKENPDATYQDAMKEILSGQNVVEETKTTKQDAEYMTKLRASLTSGGKSKYDSLEAVSSFDTKTKNLAEIGADGIVRSEVKVLEIPNLVKGVNFDVSNEELGLSNQSTLSGSKPSRNFDVEGFEVDAEGNEFIKVQTKGQNSGEFITKRIEATPKRLSAIMNAIPNKKDREVIKARIDEMKKSEFKQEYVDQDAVNDLENGIKTLRGDQVVAFLSKFLPKSKIEFDGKIFGRFGPDEVVIDGVDYSLEKQEDIDKIKQMVFEKNQDAFITDKKKKQTTTTNGSTNTQSTTGGYSTGGAY